MIRRFLRSPVDVYVALVTAIGAAVVGMSIVQLQATPYPREWFVLAVLAMVTGRFPLRIALRSSIMPGYEIRSEVTAIGPASADASLFAVPAGYQKIQPPMGGGL